MNTYLVRLQYKERAYMSVRLADSPANAIKVFKSEVRHTWSERTKLVRAIATVLPTEAAMVFRKLGVDLGAKRMRTRR